MFSFAASPFEVPAQVVAMCRDTWTGFATPGSYWSGAERLAIAQHARSARLGTDVAADSLPAQVRETVRVLGAVPSTTTQPWVGDAVAAMGEPAYVELVGIVARVVAVDTFTRLLGVDPEPFPQALPGQPEPSVRRGRRGKAWVAMTDVPVPPNVLSVVPLAQAETNATGAALYMTSAQMQDPDTMIDGLHRTQMEIVATSLSHANECFY
jgi:hypothetical protein